MLEESKWSETWRMRREDVEAWLMINITTGQGELFVQKRIRKRIHLDSIVIDKAPLQILAQNILCVFPVVVDVHDVGKWPWIQCPKCGFGQRGNPEYLSKGAKPYCPECKTEMKVMPEPTD